MNTRARIPLTPQALPQQRLHLVVDIPPCPPSFACTCDFDRALDPASRPESMPRSARFVGMAEWASSPMHNRLDAYFLSTTRARSHWILWVLGPDEWTPWKLRARRQAVMYAYGPRKGVRGRTAAAHLLHAGWGFEARTGQLDEFDFISQDGLLDVSDLRAVAKSVWAGSEDEDV